MTETPNTERTSPETVSAETRLKQVLADLAGEGNALDELVAHLDDAGWRTQTPAAGWDIAHQVAHLAWTDEVAVLAATDKGAWDDVVTAAVNDPAGFVDDAAASGATAPRLELLERWRTGRQALVETLANHPDGEKIAWFGPPMSATSMATARFMETWAHGRDVAEALGATVPATGRLRHLVHLGVRTRDFAFSLHGLEKPPAEFRIELVAPDGETWTYGPQDAEQSLHGSAYDFCLLVTQRGHRTDLDLTASGMEAQKWLEIAQAFAGPPGTGREPQGRSDER